MKNRPVRFATSTWLDAAVLTIALATLVIFRLHAFDLPLETDECNYAYIGQRLLEGDRLYVDVWDHQPFGVFVLFAAVISFFGDAPRVFRWLATAFSAMSLILTYFLTRGLGGRKAAAVAAMLFAIVSSDPGTGGEGCNREIYMNTLILVAWFLALRACGRRVSRRGTIVRGLEEAPGRVAACLFLAAGCSLAAASAIKTIAAVHWVFLAVWVGMALSRTNLNGHRWLAIISSICILALGPLSLWLGAFIHFKQTGHFGEFFDAVFLFNLGYSEGGGWFGSRFVDFFRAHGHPFKFESAMPLWLGLIPALGWLIIRSVRCIEDSDGGRDAGRSEHNAVLCLVLANYVAIALPARFWPHYYYLMVPAAVIAVSLAVGRLAEVIFHSSLVAESALQNPLAQSSPPMERRGWMTGSTLRRTVLACVVLAIVPGMVLVSEARAYLTQPPFGITVKRYNSRDFWGRAQGENVARVTDPTDRLFVYGNEASIYYYSKRRCASRYTMITGIGSGMRGAEERRRILMQDLQADPPRLILVLFDEPPFPQWREFLERHYGTAVGWDNNDRTGSPIMLVFVRRDRPIEVMDWDWDRSAVGGWHLGAANGG